MQILQIIFFAIMALFILVSVHEFGHYWVARRCGVRVLRFSIGFGKPLLRFKWGETDFVIAGIPLGGYVKMYGEQTENEEPVPEDQQVYSFTHKNVYQRMAIVVAGPLANLILAIIFYALVFGGGLTGIAPFVGSAAPGTPAYSAGIQEGWEIVSVDDRPVASWSQVFDQLVKRVGESGYIRLGLRDPDQDRVVQAQLPIENWQADTATPDLMGSLGLTPLRPPMEAVVGQVMPDSAAQRAGLQPGDRVIRAGGRAMGDWEEWRSYVRERPEQLIELEILRQGRPISLVLVPDVSLEEGQRFGLAGISPQAPEWPEHMLREVNYSFAGALGQGVVKTWETTSLILSSLRKLVTGVISTKSLGGPITIAQYAGASADAGWQSFFMFLAALSVMLGVVNLLPIPVLDGGHLMFYLIEAVKGSPLSQAAQGAAMRVGLILLFGIMILALYNDFARL